MDKADVLPVPERGVLVPRKGGGQPRGTLLLIHSRQWGLVIQWTVVPPGVRQSLGVKDTRPLGGDERQAARPLSAPSITDRASRLQGLRDTPIADRMGKGRETCVRS